MRQGWTSRFRKYAGTVSLIFAAVCANLALTRKVEPSAAPLLFAAVLIASWLGGWGAGLLATVLAVAADDFFFLAPRYAWTLSWTVLVRLAVFLTVALVTSFLTSQRERLLAAERQARLDAEQANQIKDRFLAATSHELRTPLCAITFWLDTARQNDAPQFMREGIEIIRSNTDAIRHIIEDLLDVSRIARGKLRVEKRPLDLSEPVRAAINALRPQAAANGLQLEVSLASPAARVDADFAACARSSPTFSPTQSNSPPTVAKSSFA